MLRILAARNLFRRNKVQVSHASALRAFATRNGRPLIGPPGLMGPPGACSDLFGFFCEEKKKEKRKN
jgi:hypothetical protein